MNGEEAGNVGLLWNQKKEDRDWKDQGESRDQYSSRDPEQPNAHSTSKKIASSFDQRGYYGRLQIQPAYHWNSNKWCPISSGDQGRGKPD